MERNRRSSKHRPTAKSATKDKEPAVLEDTSSANQDEIVYHMQDETDCVEVEIGDESQLNVTPANVTPEQSPKGLTSKKTTPKQIAPAASTIGNTPINTNAKIKNKKRRDSDTSSEEERWLTAIESGKLDNVVDELKKIRDPKLMTARQRAMYERGIEGGKEADVPFVDMLMSLPTGYREKSQTQEDDQKRILKIQKRKQLADEKREKDKQRTMDRLLNKKENTKQRAAARSKAAASKTSVPMISYRNTAEGAHIQMPLGVEFPLTPQTAREPPAKVLCGIAGCNNPKIYNCSKTNIPLCSLTCYRKNVQAIRQIMC